MVAQQKSHKAIEHAIKSCNWIDQEGNDSHSIYKSHTAKDILDLRRGFNFDAKGRCLSRR